MLISDFVTVWWPRISYGYGTFVVFNKQEMDQNKQVPFFSFSREMIAGSGKLVNTVINFMESDSLESCIRNSYRYLCDRDTIAAISAPMAAIFYNDLRMQG